MSNRGTSAGVGSTAVSPLVVVVVGVVGTTSKGFLLRRFLGFMLGKLDW